MHGTAPRQRSPRITGRSDIGRAEGFSDGVLAIIITLLVLDLKPPQGEPGRLLAGLLAQWPTYVAYATSYLYVAVIWLNHKATFKRIHTIDRGLHWANVGVLFTTALLPFATAVIADAVQKGNPSDARTAVGLYALVGALLCVSWLWLFHRLHTNPHLIESHVEEGFFQQERTRAWVGVALYVIAGVIGSVIAPTIALTIFFALAVFYGFTSEGLFAAQRRSK